MKSTIKILSLAALVLAITGCSVPYKCKLGEECANVQDAYDAAVSNAGNHESTMPNNKKGKPSKKSIKKALEDSWEPYSGNKLLDQPVYQPPSPIRIWIAPWRLLDGNQEYLLSGQYIYAQRPGRWAMGSLRNPGAGSGALYLSPQQPEGEAANNRIVQPKERIIQDTRLEK